MDTKDAHAGERLTISIQLVRGSDPIRGRILDGGEVAVDFVGWLALAATIERLASGNDDED